MTNEIYLEIKTRKTKYMETAKNRNRYQNVRKL